MTKKKRAPGKAGSPPLVPRSGPPTNIRPGGPHEDSAEKKREDAIRKALRRIDVEDDAL